MAMERKKTNQICTVEEFGKFKSIHGRFERSTSLSGYEKVKLVEDLRSVWPRLVEVGDEMDLCFDDHKQEPDSQGRVPYPVLPRALILEKLILGDEMPFFFKSLVKSVSEFFKASPLDVDLNLLRVKNTVRDFHLVMIRLREQFGEEVEARYGIGKRYVRFYNLPGHFQIETLPRSDTQQLHISRSHQVPSWFGAAKDLIAGQFWVRRKKLAF